MPSVNIYVLDSRLAANSLQSVPYSKLNFDEQPRKHVEATGIFLHLFGRSDKQKNQIILIEGSHTLTSSSDTNPSRLGGTGVLQCQIVSR